MADVKRFSDAEISRLVKFYEQAEREILDRLNRALLRGNKTEYLAQMKKNIEAILQQLREGNRTWCSEAIPRVYSQGLYRADAMLKDAGISTSAAFGAIHQQAAQVLAENAYQRFEDVVQVIGRQVNDIYRELALENVRGTVVGYDTWKQTARRFREQLAERGVTGFKDRSGRMWNMRTYTEMVARTTTMQAHLEGTANRLVEQGHDLIKVSTHRGACPLCEPWQGKILSITGKTKGYPTLEEARAAGLFHPNCYSKDTEVYTDKGWRLFSELSSGEKILSLNPETHYVEWVDYKSVVSYHYTGNMMRFKSNSLDLLVTPDHNMYVGMNSHLKGEKIVRYRLMTAEQLKERNFKIPRTAKWEGESSKKEFMGIPIEQFAKLLGYFLSEGHAEYDRKNRRYRVSICQHDKRNMEIMYNDLKSIGFYECHNRLILSGKELASYFMTLGKAHEKHIPDWFLQQPPEILRLFLDAYRLGDGSTREIVRHKKKLKSIERKYFTSSTRLAEQIGECILKVGNYPYFYLQKCGGEKVSFKNGDYIINHDVWAISENTSPHSVHNASPSCRHRGIQITEEYYDDMVYCAELEKNHVLWVRRNGRTAWCGNCRHAYGLYIDLDKEIEELEAEERAVKDKHKDVPAITPQDFDQEIYDRIKASKRPGNLMLQPEYEEIFLKKGFSREEIGTVKKILSDYGGVAAQQKKAMETIAAEIKNDSRIGKLLRATSDLEEAAVEVWQSGLENRIQKILKDAKEDWDLFGQAEGFSKDYSDFSEVETAIRMRLEKETSLVVYRKGDLGRPIESWTADPLGTDIGAGRRLTPDHAMTLSEMHKRGYNILGGTCRMMGAPGEMEVTFINFDKCLGR